MSKPKISKLKKKLMELIKAHVRRRDNYTCQHCGKQVEGSNCHVSHVRPVSSGNALAFDPINMKVLCYHCHINWFHKNPLEAAEWFKVKFYDRWEYLQEHKNDIVHWKEADYLRMIAEAQDL
jgi:5-methylcytosine-specific restriction endonuclease McrA